MSFRLTPQVAAALRSGRYPIAPLVEVIMPGQDPLWHLVGSYELMWGNKRFVGRDPRSGCWWRLRTSRMASAIRHPIGS